MVHQRGFFIRFASRSVFYVGPLNVLRNRSVSSNEGLLVYLTQGVFSLVATIKNYCEQDKNSQ